MRRFRGDKLVIATHNEGKRREFAALLQGRVKTIISSADLGLPEPEETGKTFEENAILKARAAAEAARCVALADDSGLCVNALGGKPGIYSARWALPSEASAQGSKPEKDFAAAMARVHKELGDAVDRSAYFMCVLALAFPDGSSEAVGGRVDGHIIWPPRGNSFDAARSAVPATARTHGHGYDPIFVPEDHRLTFAEMDAGEKNRLSHRGKAARALIEKFFT